MHGTCIKIIQIQNFYCPTYTIMYDQNSLSIFYLYLKKSTYYSYKNLIILLKQMVLTSFAGPSGRTV